MVEEVMTVSYKCGFCGVKFDSFEKAVACEEMGIKKIKFRDLYGDMVDTWSKGDYIYDLSMASLYKILDSVNDGHNIRPFITNIVNDKFPCYPTENFVIIHKGVYNKLKDNMNKFGDY